MSILKYTILSIVLFSCSSSNLQTQNSDEKGVSSEIEFWNWFEKNEKRVFEFEKNMVPIFNEISEQLKKVNPDLVFEIGPINSAGKREFVISADGVKTAFPYVRKVYQAGPKLDNWSWVKFRQRKSELHEFTIGNMTIDPKEIHVVMARDKKKVGLIIIFKDYTEEKRNIYANAAFILLDQALGEYDAETKLSFILYENRKSRYFDMSFPITDLGDRFDDYYSSQSD